LGASAFVLEGITDPETMEALACREGLSLALDLNMQRFSLACDSMNVIRSLTGTGMGAYGHVVRECKARASVFSHSEFVHEGIEC
jgi:ribonuclease HI